MGESVPIAPSTLRKRTVPPTARASSGALLTAGCLAFFIGNIVAIVWIWVANDNLNFSFAPSLSAAVLARFGGLAGLLAAYLALIQVLLLARLPWLDRVAGFDRLTVWHRWNGYACLTLVLAHTVMVVEGYAIDGHRSFFQEFWKMVDAGLFPGMVTATVGTVLFVVVTVSSIVIVRRHLSYELWYAVHLTAYAAIALAWFHQIPPAASSPSTRARPATGASSSSARSSCSCFAGSTKTCILLPLGSSQGCERTSVGRASFPILPMRDSQRVESGEQSLDR